MYDFFAYVLMKHKNKIETVLRDSMSNHMLEFKDRKAIWYEKHGRQKIKIKEKNLTELIEEPVKTHLLFYELEEGKHSSWKSALTEFYKLSLENYKRELRKELPEIFTQKELCSNIIKKLSFELTFTSPLFTASENKFYSISNPIAKERATGLPILKGSSLKGALRHAAVVNIENELLEKNYCNNFLYYSDLEKKVEIQEIVKKEEDENDRFYFKKRSQLVKLFGNEREPKWFTIKSLLATGGIKDVKNVKDILEKINNAFEHYLKKKQIVNSEGVSRGRLIFEDLHFKKVTLDVITPLDREKKTPVRGPIFYEVIPAGQEVTGKLLWFPFDLIAKGELEKIEDDWNEDKRIIEKAFEELSKTGIGAKTKDGWGRFEWEALNES